MFGPALASTTTLSEHSSFLAFTLDDALDDAHERAQVWTDFPDGRWHAVDFARLPSSAQLSLASHAHSHEARVSFDSLPLPAYSFTYRILDLRDGSIRWLGEPNSNGTLLRSQAKSPFLLESPGWVDDAHVVGARAWNGPLPSDVLRFGGPSDFHAWAITADSAIVRFRLANNNAIEFEGGAGSSGILPTADAAPLAAQLVALALFPAHDRPVLLAGDDLRLTLNPANTATAHSENNASDVHADRSVFTLHARSKVTLRRDFDASVLYACVKPLVGLRQLEIRQQDFFALYTASGSARMVTVLPTSSRSPSRSILRLHGLDALVETPCALYCSGSRRAYFPSRVDSSLDILTPPDGGDIVVGSAHKSRDGNIVALLQPADATADAPRPSPVSVPDQRTLALRRGLLSLPALCAIAWLLLTTVLRFLPSFAPVRLALALSERFERFLNERAFGIPQPASPATANGKSIAQNGTIPARNEIVLAFPRDGKKTNLVTLLVRTEAAGTPLPALYFGSVRATVVAQRTLEPDRSTTLLQLERSVNAPTLRIVF